MLVVGVDEVGRGALVGDLVVCAVQFSHGVESALEGAGCELLDSKAFTTRRRRERAPLGRDALWLSVRVCHRWPQPA